MASACVEVRGLWVAYRGSPWVLRGVDLEVRCGELVVIASRSGGGKTTLLRVLAGLIPWFYPARLRGRVRVMGVDPTAVRPEEVAAVVGFVRQNPYTQLVAPTVFDEVLGVLLNTGMDPVDARRRTREVLERFGLWRYRDYEPWRLSLGLQQRLVIAAALALDQPLLLLDEPTAYLDPEEVGELVGLLSELRRGGKTVIVAEQRLTDVLPVATRLAVISGGRTAVYSDPRSAIGEAERYGVDAPPVTRMAKLLGLGSPLPISVEDMVEAVRGAYRGA